MKSTADLIDEHEDSLRSCAVQFRQFGRTSRFFGAIRTLKTLEDNALIKATLSEAGDGSVLVVDGEGSLQAALVGDVIAGLALANRWAGLIVFGAVRDTPALANLDIGIKALGSNPRKSRKTGAGQLDVPVQFGGTTFRPGDWVYSDEDGLVLSVGPI
jgi:regulator of ribonuclease activity A